jgi:hypothetical protein
MSVIRQLKTEPNGRCFRCLGSDGVVRVWHFDLWHVIDAVGLSPLQIKEWLERRPFDQAQEDRFRGVDGRTVSKEDMFDPPADIVPERPPRELVEKHEKRHQELMEERKRTGWKPDPNAPKCVPVKRSTYNLDPI